MYVAFASDPSADRLQKDLYLTFIWFIEESKIKVKGVLDKRNFLLHTNARRQFVNREVSSQYLFSLCKSDKTLLNLGPEKPQACPPCHLRKGYLDRTYLWKTGFCWEEKKNLIKQIAPTIDQPRSAPGFALIETPSSDLSRKPPQNYPQVWSSGMMPSSQENKLEPWLYHFPASCCKAQVGT